MMKKKIGLILSFLLLILIVGCNNVEHQHTFSKVWSSNEEYHYYTSTCGHDVTKGKALHIFDEGVVTKEATEEETGIKTYTCIICQYEKYETIDKVDHEHTFSNEWTTTETHHYHASTCGHDVTKDNAPHIFDEGVVTKEATEEETGIKTYTCITCQYEKYETIDKVDHKHTFSSEWTTTEMHHYHASTCGHDIRSDFGSHTFDDGVIKEEATTEHPGLKVYTCTICNYQSEVVIPIIDKDSFHINAYNTQDPTEGFLRYEGIELFKKGVTVGSSLYWYKIAIKYENGGYKIIEIAESESRLTVGLNYDYLILSYSGDKSGMYNHLVNFGLEVGDILLFSVELDTLSNGSVSVDVKKASSEFTINYQFDKPLYNTKKDLYNSFFTDYYNFLIENTDCDMSEFNINNVEDFLTFCQTWDANGCSELAGVGNAFGKYFLNIVPGGTFENQETTHFIGYCYQNNKYIDLLEHLEVFFAYWRTDEGYTQGDPHGNDFFYSSWASFVDTCKFFYFTSESITEKYPWYTYERSPRVHYMLDHIPFVVSYSFDNNTYEKEYTLPTLSSINYRFLGWFDDNGNLVNVVNSSTTVTPKFERIIQTVTFKNGNEIIDEVEVKHGLTIKKLPDIVKDNLVLVGFVDEDFNEYDFINAITRDLVFYARWAGDFEEIGTMRINAYNTQSATDGFNQYDGLELFKKGVSIGSSLYWHKVGVTLSGSDYIITEIAGSGHSLTKSYDYLILSYGNETTGTYDKFVGLGLNVGDKVRFNVNLDTLSNGSVNVQVTFERGEKLHMVILEGNGADHFSYQPFYKEGSIYILDVPTKEGSTFLGWFDNPEFTGNLYQSIPTVLNTDIKLYAKWAKNEINSPLDFVSDVVTSYTLDELPENYEDYTFEWMSSDNRLYTIEDGIGHTNRMYQTHQIQHVTVSVKATRNGESEVLSKEITIDPVLFDPIEHPKAVYFAISSMASYEQYNERFKTDGTYFSDKFKENMNLVYYAFALPQPDGTLKLDTKYINELMELKNHGIRVTFVIDGATGDSLRVLVKLCNDDLTRAKFVSSIVDMVVKYNFDGVDVDWEFPGVLSSQSGYGEYTTEVDRLNLNKLLRDIRAKLDTIQDPNGSNFLLTVATPPTYWGVDRFDYDGRYSNGVGGINDYCDYVNMMSYDLNKSNLTSHLCHVYQPSNSISYKFCCEYGISYYTSLGLPKSKIILGAAAYGKAYKITGTVNESSNLPGLGVAGTLGQVNGYGLPTQSITWNSGTIFYTGIEILQKSSNFVKYDEYNNSGKFVGSYLYSKTDKYFITFDSEQAVKEKCLLAQENEGMGIMVWAYGEDATDTIVHTICDNL